ncbi:MAG: hypothetical protein QE271_04780 [Bacteriovoracaceae bacterium]|nr:hypothetical protein [Bacteriovoracaceae bacterium]
MKSAFLVFFSLLSTFALAQNNHLNCTVTLPDNTTAVVNNINLNTNDQFVTDANNKVAIKSYPYTYLNAETGESEEFKDQYSFQVILNYKKIGGNFNAAINNKKVINLIGNYSTSQSIFELFLNLQNKFYSVKCILVP